MKVETSPMDTLAIHLKQLRIEHGMSLDMLANASGVSRASLSRIEKGDVSPTAQVLAKLCTAFNITLSRLMLMVESQSASLIKFSEQIEWQDSKSGFKRRCVSPPNKQLRAEVIHCELPENSHIQYEHSPIPNLEHHLVLQQGHLMISIEGKAYELKSGDCLRYTLNGSSSFKVIGSETVKYYLTLV